MEDDEDFGQPGEREEPQENLRDRTESRQAARDAARALRKAEAREARERNKAEADKAFDDFFKPREEEKKEAPVNFADPRILTALQDALPNLEAPKEEPIVPQELLPPAGFENPLQLRDTSTPKKAVQHIPLLPYVRVKAKDPDTDDWRIYFVHGYREDTPVAKTAILPFINAEGTLEYIGWFCAEEPEARFFDTIEVFPDWRGKATISVAPEFISSVEEGTIRVISVQASDTPAMGSATYDPIREKLSVQVKTSSLFRRCERALVRIEGRRKKSPPRWKRYSPEVAYNNATFWARAHQVL